ncbi:isoleucyl-tRNA synthetase [Campylobacter sp. 9BO]|uniref:isoleucyl-tRNA synthetase n=1 Tax=Campylobacter sp. 9BO TaxID=3424759 RepID=UPI003D32E4B4
MKFLNAFFVGSLLTFAVAFVVFTGLFSGYFKHYGIDEYFNAVFVDNVPFLWLLPVGFVVGYFIFYTPFRKFSRVVYVLVLLASASLWHSELGRKFGEMLFMSEIKNVSVSENVTINAREIYSGRTKIYLLKDDEQVFKIKR